MQNLKKLKQKSIGSILFLVLFFVVMGVVLIIGSNIFYQEPPAQNLYDVPRDQLEGAYVTVDLEWIYDCYAYTETYENNRPTGEITQKEYLIDANETDYLCLILEGDLMEQADALLEECIAYYNWETDQITKAFTVTGEVKPLSSESISLLHEFMAYDQLSPEEQEIILPLYLSPADTETDYVMLILGFIFAVFGLAFLAAGLAGSYQKQVKAKLQELFGDNTERSDEFLGQLMETPAVCKLHISGGYILLAQGTNQMLLDSKDVLWAYKQTVRQKLYGFIPVGKNHRLVIKRADGKELFVVMKEEQIKEQLKKIAVQFPSCAIGYSDQMAALYKKDPNIMRQVAAAQRQKATK